MRAHPRADHGDRPFGGGVEVNERAPLWLVAPGRRHPDAEPLELVRRPAPELVVAERGQEETVAGQPRELDGRDGAASSGLLPGFHRVDDLARGGNVLDARELDPLDVADDGDAHQACTRARSAAALTPSP
jgi:hypothetical protein